MRAWLCVLAVVVLSGCAAPPPAAAPGPAPSGVAWPEADAAFQQEPRWRGADSAYSIDLGAGRLLWLFGDTFVAPPGGSAREGSTMVSNTVAIQDGADPLTARISFYWREPEPPLSLLPPPLGATAEAFVPDDNSTRHWPAHGARLGSSLVLFFMKVEAAEGGLGFRLTGGRAFLVPNPDAPPLEWTLRPAAFPDRPDIRIGAMGVTVVGEHLLAYSPNEERDVFLARWPVALAARGELAAPEWWTAGGWSSDGAPAPVMRGGAPEGSVHALPNGTFLAVQATGFPSGVLDARTATAPEGPWSEPRTFFRPPEASREEAFVYSGKAHAGVATEGLAVTYSTNHREFSGLVADDSLYWPRFVRLDLRSLA